MPLLHPSVEILACVLHKCRSLGQMVCVQTYMHQEGLDMHATLTNHLVVMFIEVGSVCHAQQVFESLPYREEPLWSSLIVAFVKYRMADQAFTLYQRMQEEGPLQPSSNAVMALLKACIMVSNLEIGTTLHGEIARRGLLERDIFVGSSLVDMYAKCGCLSKAQEVFDKLPERDVVLWTTLIGGYSEHGSGAEALACAKLMQLEGISLDAVTIVCCLRACSSLGAKEMGQEIHTDIAKKALETELLVGNSLVDMYARCGSLATAQDLFDKLPVRNVVSWNALMTGYVEQGDDEKALECLGQMHSEGISGDSVTLVCSLKACGNIKDAVKGQEVHSEIACKGLNEDLFIGNTLVHMYAKCGWLAEAEGVLDNYVMQDVVAYTALIAGYVEYGCGEEALNCFERMHRNKIFLNVVTFVCCLKACGSIGATLEGQDIHAEIIKRGWERELLLGNTLIDMYGKCDVLEAAQDVFDQLPERDVVSWNALITGYVEHGYYEKAFAGLRKMQSEGISFNSVTYICSLNACGSMADAEKGLEMHTAIVKKGLERETFVRNTVVDFYAKCGLLTEAQDVFHKLPVQDMVSCNAILIGYAENGFSVEAFNCFEQMQCNGIALNAISFVCSLKACSSIGALVKGQELHSEIIRAGLERDLHIGSTLVDMYAKCGWLEDAQVVFDKLSVHDMVLWTALLAGYANHGHHEEALNCLQQMQHGVALTSVVFICVLKTCGTIGDMEKGLEIHAETVRKGLEKELLISSSLVTMYAKCGWFAEAQQILDKLPVRDVVLWTALLAGYLDHGWCEEALQCFEKMQQDGISPNAVALFGILKACGCLRATQEGQGMHAEILKKGLEGEVLIGNILVDMYIKSGWIGTAQAVFDRLTARDVISWTALVAGYAERGHVEEALHWYERLNLDGISPNAITFLHTLKSCGSIGAIIKAQEIHAGIIQMGLEEVLVLGNVLIDTYTKCSLVVEAQDVFDKILVQDTISWNALIAGYALLGESGKVFEVFEKMMKVHLYPNLVTFLSVLNACSHAGLMNESQAYFELMTSAYGYTPTCEHYTCMADLFSRAGHTDKVMELIERMPFTPDSVVWHIVLEISRKWGDVKLARLAFEHTLQCDESTAAPYVCMSNIFADAANQEDLDEAEVVMGHMH